jgi:hypothetical protein
MREDKVMSFVDELRRAADSAAAVEAQFRKDAAERIALLECERAFAFRRLNLMRAVSDAVARAETEEEAISDGLAALRAKLDWPNENDSPLMSRFSAVAQAIFASLKGSEEELERGLAETLAEFERWHVSAYGVPFWMLFEQPMAETPRVDF